MDFTLKSSDQLCFSIIVTGRCNLNCSYCHYYKRHQRDKVSFDISEELFDKYLDFILLVKERHHQNIQVRFSGGEPLLLESRLFNLANRVYRTLGVKPYILTNGGKLNQNIIDKSIDSNISAYLVSLENPFDIDDGALDPAIIIRKIKTYNSEALPLKPGVVIVRNHMFSRLLEICDYFYGEIEEIPTVTELNFLSFQPPADFEISELNANVHKIVNKYFSRVALDIFPYITPELANCFQNRYLIEFGLTDSLKIQETKDDDEGIRILYKYLDEAYPLSTCSEAGCDWYACCHRIKWVWENNFRDYCRMKKAISDAYYDALVETQ
jgi:hypothetical protein